MVVVPVGDDDMREAHSLDEPVMLLGSRSRTLFATETKTVFQATSPKRIKLQSLNSNNFKGFLYDSVTNAS
jgi:hypothetical protein